MIYIAVLLIIFFLIWAAGRETKYGGLGLLWRITAWVTGVFVVGGVLLFAYFAYLEHKTDLEQLRQAADANERLEAYLSASKKQDTPTSIVQEPRIDNTVDFSIVSKEALIRSYYQAIDRKEFEMAYSLFTKEYAKKVSLKTWSEGYAETLSHTIASITCTDNSCRVELDALDLKTQTGSTRYVFDFTLSDADLSGGYKISGIKFLNQ